ncbi:MAG: hypothetical protein K2N08_04915, partial [Muribaculaceae bacterium]|nr:hypothetical protein [Muribaculaceae bacterium]
ANFIDFIKFVVNLRHYSMSMNVSSHSCSQKKFKGNVPAMLLILLFAAYYCGSTLFVHSHFIGYGDKVVTHSHPFAPNSNHTHTDYEFNAIACLNDIVSDDVAFDNQGEIDEILLAVIPVEGNSHIIISDRVLFQLRGPPVSFC